MSEGRQGMKVIVAGGRDWYIAEPGAHCLERTLDGLGATLVITGGARGIDTAALKLARALEYPTHVEHADWNFAGPFAGPIRNAKMAEMGDVLIAFPGGKGTANMVHQMEKLGKKVIDWRQEGQLVTRTPVADRAAT